MTVPSWAQCDLGTLQIPNGFCPRTGGQNLEGPKKKNQMGFPNHGIQPIPNQSIVVFLAHPDTIDHEIEVLEVGNYIYILLYTVYTCNIHRCIS
jgi:hypothetical protein